MDFLPRRRRVVGARRVGAGPWAALALALLLWGLAAPFARADEAEDLRGRFVNGGVEARQGVLRALEGRPEKVGAVLGPVLKDRSVRIPSAHAAAWLVDNPSPGGEILLVDEILRRAQDDPAWTDDVRALLTPAKGGWTAVMRAARRSLSDGSRDASLRACAAWILRYDQSGAAAHDLADAWASGPPVLAASAADSLSFLLAFRFEDAAAAQRFVAAHERQPFVEWLRDLSASKDTVDAPMYRRLVQEARANVERVVTLTDLERYLRVKDTPWPEVRRLAARRAVRLEAPPDAWSALLETVVREETDRETLLALLDVASRLKNGGAERSARLADAVVSRLQACCNSPDLLKGLLGVLAQVGDPASIARAHDRIKSVQDPGVLEIWLSAAGAVGGSEIALTLCDFHRARVDRTDEASIALRARALEALAQGARAAGATSSSVAVASTYLRGILRRDDANGDERTLPRETAPAARMAAVRSLEGFPSPETVARLRELARVPPEDAPTARLAVSVLGKLAARTPEAAQALVDVAVSDAVPDVRIEAVRDLARIAPDAPDPVRTAAIAAVRAALAPNVRSRDLRLAAAESAASLGDAEALPAVFDLAASLGRDGPPAAADAGGAALETLVSALVRVDGTHDAAIADELAALATTGSLDRAIQVARSAADAGSGRLPLQTARAALLRRRSRLEGRDAAARRADLEEAHRILRSVLSTGAATEPGGDGAAKAFALHQEVAVALLEDPEVRNGLRRSALLCAVEMVGQRHDVASAAQASEWIAQARAMPDLSEEDRQRLDRAAAQVAALSSPPPAR